jgi:hypothetical protein
VVTTLTGENPIGEALPIAKQIAETLDAHEQRGYSMRAVIVSRFIFRRSTACTPGK